MVAILQTSSTLKPDLRYEAKTNVVGGRPKERLGEQGGFTHGVVIHHKNPGDLVNLREEQHGVVLHNSSTLVPDERFELKTNMVRPDERYGEHGGYLPGARVFAGGAPRDVPILPDLVDHGIVLATSESLTSMDHDVETNVIGGRPEERHSSGHGGFTAGVRIWGGGCPRDVVVPIVNDHGIILGRFGGLVVYPAADVGELNERGERVNSSGHGGFHHGVVSAEGGPFRVSAAAASANAEVQVPKGWRRGGAANFTAGATILAGGAPRYDGDTN